MDVLQLTRFDESLGRVDVGDDDRGKNDLAGSKVHIYAEDGSPIRLRKTDWEWDTTPPFEFAKRRLDQRPLERKGDWLVPRHRANASSDILSHEVYADGFLVRDVT